MSKKTALKILIEELLYHLAYDDDLTIESTVMLQNVIEKCKIKLELERQQIIDAHIEGQRVFDAHPHTQWTNDQAEQYYKETYKTNKQ